MSDALSQILDHLKLKGSIYFHTDFHKPWGIKVPFHSQVIRFHMVMRGECYFRIDGVREPVFLNTRDLIVLPRGVSHEIIDSHDGSTVDVETLVASHGFSDSGALMAGKGDDLRPCQLICGHFEFSEGATHPMLGALPDYMLIGQGEIDAAPWLEAAMRFMSSEITEQHPGAEAVVHRLAEVVFIQVVRSFVQRKGDAAGMFAAVLDPQLGASMSEVHAAPSKNWTVASLASIAGMSRTVYAQKFRELVGMTPIEYVTFWRMQIARQHLVEGSLSMIDVAQRIGFGSEASFSRAIKRAFDLTPGQIRRGSGEERA